MRDDLFDFGEYNYTNKTIKFGKSCGDDAEFLKFVGLDDHIHQ